MLKNHGAAISGYRLLFDMIIKPKEEKSVKRKIGKKLFKKGNLLGYKKDTL